mmetsp:Transcript_26945/g.44879  ORF Transcript_26945/g.44879 Transcript_26945/m.44879 type:complete len:690 (+) Transcript_26945:131-2200(+)|eukprot:CAMPEP_0119004344 /NCGR_PEP_ID=MMETSP1176-20130426/1087_1 /TAXON_ID=265551 /ORGANISM="Synedropsis recta cf, Strain CCMP1620" /LENGTH=689 /DNA_ID=CAMNT_0006956035 /DNA_START=263 /DNA_END=2332 /DNA_ORIENTATION=-
MAGKGGGGSASSSSADDAKAADYKSTDRDVIVGDRTNTRLVNRLLSDYVSLYHQLGFAKNAPVKKTAQQLVKLFQDGLGGATFLHGEGFFVKIFGASSAIATEEDAIDFVEKMLVEELYKPVQELEEGEEPNESNEANGDKESASKESDASEPTEFDVKVGSTLQQEDFAKHKGNERFLQLLDKYTASDKVTITTSHTTRVKAACLTLRRTVEVSDSTKARFMRKGDKDTWIVLGEKAAAEFVLSSVFDTLLQKDLPAAFAGAMDLKTLIPSIGTAEISQFTDFSKPGTSPITETHEYDVLFGRGGMTNNHAGNKRFRDVISLHRPDYVRAIKIEKPNVARRIVAAIRGGSPKGRFLKRNATDLMWYDVGNRHATEKTSQALREKSQSEKNGKMETASEGDVRKRMLEQALYEARVTRMRLSKEGGVGSGCLDPSTFKLLIPPQYMPAMDVTIEMDDPSTSAKSSGESKTDDAAQDKKTDKGVRKLSLPLDLKDIKMMDANGVTGPSSSIGELDDNGDMLVTENDILCGRGGLTNHHKGNKRFRDIVALHRPDYVRAAKVHKPSVARMIVKAIRNSDPPGRFLKKDIKTGKWYDIGDKRAAEKASQALREKTPEERTRPESGDDSTAKASENDEKDSKGDKKKAKENGNDNAVKEVSKKESKKEEKEDAEAKIADAKTEIKKGNNVVLV